jgi:maltose O-acetyltransferase
MSLLSVTVFLLNSLLYFTNRVVANIPFHFIRLSFYRYCLGLEIAPGSHIFLEAWFDTKKTLRWVKIALLIRSVD